MTDNMKRFLEAASQDKEFTEKLTKAKTPEDVIALAAEKGFTLTEEDLKPQPVSGEMPDAELDAVAGGGDCGCFMGGGGSSDHIDDSCWCVAGGYGFLNDGTSRCMCILAGAGDSHKSMYD